MSSCVSDVINMTAERLIVLFHVSRLHQSVQKSPSETTLSEVKMRKYPENESHLELQA